MATRFVNFENNKSLVSSSPIAHAAFLSYYILLHIFVGINVIFVFLLVMGGGIIYLLFQFTPRLVWLVWKFLAQADKLTPNFTDKEYLRQDDIDALNKFILSKMDKSRGNRSESF